MPRNFDDLEAIKVSHWKGEGEGMRSQLRLAKNISAVMLKIGGKSIDNQGLGYMTLLALVEIQK